MVELLTDGTGIWNGEYIEWKVEHNRLYILSLRTTSYSLGYNVTATTMTITDDKGSKLVFTKI